MNVRRNQTEVFSFLRDRVAQKLQGWRNKPISKTGKITLLKTVAQSIPNFWLNLFLLPTEISNGIQRQMNGFWWSSGITNKGIQWKSWEKMCTTKRVEEWVLESCKSLI